MPMNGILLMCFGTSTYGMYAYNMAYSIKYYNPGINVHLLADNESINDIDTSVFDSFDIIYFEQDELGRRDNCLAKIRLFERSPFEKTIYLDVDGICIKSLDSLWKEFENVNVFAQVIDSGKRGDEIEYNIWASNETIWNKFNLSDEAILPALQTSIIYFDKSESAKEFFLKLEENYKNRLQEEEYKVMWGKSKQHPDELYYSVTMAQLGILPDQKKQPIYFPQKSIQDSELFAKYSILSMYGAHGLVKPFAFSVYDRVLHKIMNEQKKNHYYKAHRLYKGKFAGKKK